MRNRFSLYPYYLRSEGRGEGVVVQKAWLFDYRKELKQMETFWAVHVYWKWGLFPFNMLDNNQFCVFTLLEMIWLKVWAKPLPKNAKRLLLVICWHDMCPLKSSFLKLPFRGGLCGWCLLVGGCQLFRAWVLIKGIKERQGAILRDSLLGGWVFIF